LNQKSPDFGRELSNSGELVNPGEQISWNSPFAFLRDLLGETIAA
jgi:hypothetical protein